MFSLMAPSCKRQEKYGRLLPDVHSSNPGIPDQGTFSPPAQGIFDSSTDGLSRHSKRLAPPVFRHRAPKNARPAGPPGTAPCWSRYRFLQSLPFGSPAWLPYNSLPPPQSIHISQPSSLSALLLPWSNRLCYGRCGLLECPVALPLFLRKVWAPNNVHESSRPGAALKIEQWRQSFSTGPVPRPSPQFRS